MTFLHCDKELIQITGREKDIEALQQVSSKTSSKLIKH